MTKQRISLSDFEISIDLNKFKKIDLFSKFLKCEDIYEFLMYNLNLLRDLEPHYIRYSDFNYKLIFKQELHASMFVERVNKYIEEQEHLPVFLALKESSNESYP